MTHIRNDPEERFRDDTAINYFSLVLEGGGAKGAYTAGALKALREAGYEFSRVAGTSAGALNAVAVATDAFEKSEKLWRGLSIWQLLVGRGQRLYHRAWQLIFFMAVSLPMLLLNFLSAAFSNRQDLIGQNVRFPILLSAAFYGLNSSLAYILSMIAMDCHANGAMPVLGALYGTLLLQMMYQYTAFQKNAYIFWIVLFCIVSVPMSLFFEFAESINCASLPGAIAFILGLAAIHIPKKIISLIDTGYIEETLQSFLEMPINKECIVTFSALSRVMPYKSTVAVPDHQHPMYPDLSASFNLIKRSKNIPIYRKIGKLDRQGALWSIIASAALPLGIIKSVPLKRRTFEDGGVADNCPVLSLLLKGDARKILIIKVNPIDLPQGIRLNSIEGQAIAKDFIRGQLLDVIIRRLGRVVLRRFKAEYCHNIHSDLIRKVRQSTNEESSRIHHAAERMYNEALQEQKYLLEKFDRAEVVVFAPNASLGNFISATMAFFPEKLKFFFRLGYIETNKQLIDSSANIPSFSASKLIRAYYRLIRRKTLHCLKLVTRSRPPRA